MTVLLGLISASSPGVQQATPGEDAVRFDTIYSLVGQRRFAEARDEWNRLAPSLQESLGTALAPSPAAEEARQRRVAEALFVQGLLAARLGPKDEALRLLQQADGYGFPPLDSPLMRLGAALLLAGRLGAAEPELEEVLRRAPRHPQANFYLGALRFEQKRTAESRRFLEQELALDPRCYGCMAKLAHVAYLDGDDRLCESWLAKATALDPDYVETRFVSAMLANRAGRHDQAVRDLVRVVAQAPGYAPAQYQLALAYRRSGDAEKARQHQEIYNRLIQEQKAKTIGVRGTE
jgi:tetratricopeptide (TPR) repeat protein